MQSEIVDSVQLDGTVEPSVTIMELFLAADPVVKLVILMLILASVWCWAIIFQKITRMRTLQARARAFEDQFWSGGSLEDLTIASAAIRPIR